MNDSDNGPLIIGPIVALLFGAFIYVSKHWQDETDPQAVTVATPVSSAEYADTAEAVPILPVNENQATEVRSMPETRTIYVCNKGGQRVFSDNFCGANAKTRTLSQTNIMDRQQPTYQPTEQADTSRNAAQNSSTGDASSADCSDFEKQLKYLDERMQQRYTAAEGEYLRDSWRSASTARDACYRKKRLC